MAEIRYYRWAAVLPIVLPVFAYPVSWHTPGGGVVGGIASLIVLSGLAGGPAYLPFMCALLWYLRGKTVSVYRYASLLAPVLFAPIFVVYLLVLEYFLPSPEPFLENAVFYLRYMLGVGFAYVALVHALRLGLWRCGWFNDRQVTV